MAPSEDPLRATWPVEYHDDLTDLNNRRLLTHLLGEAWERVANCHPTLALLKRGLYPEVLKTLGG